MNRAKGDFRHLLTLMWPERASIGVAIVTSVLVAAASVAQPALVAAVISDVRAGNPVVSTTLILVGCILLATIFGTVQGFVLQLAGERVVLRQRTQLLNHIARLTIPTLDGQRYGDLVSRVSSDTTVVRQIMGQGLIGILGGALTFLFAITAMVFIDPVLFLLAAGIAAASIVTAAVVSRRVRSVSHDVQENVGRLAAGLYRYLGAVRTIRAADATPRETRALESGATAAYSQGVRAARVQSLVTPLSGLTSQAAVLVVLGVGGIRFAAGEISIEGLVAFFLYLFMMISPLGQFFSTLASVNSALGAVQRIREVLAMPTEPVGIGEGTSAPRSTNPTSPAVEFRRVTFSYATRETIGSDHRPTAPLTNTPVIRDVSFAVARGSRTALVGPSGAGKSTIFALIERFYSPDQGSILVDGVPSADVDLGSLRRQIGYVEQDAPILSGTILDNLRLGAPDASSSECIAALNAVNLRQLAPTENALLALDVGESGVLLSGGERQRLALARTLLADPEMLLLDEISSNLDANNEALTHEAIDRAAEGRTVIVIAHRLATVQRADQIILMEDGEVRATGNHRELLETSALYRELAHGQLLPTVEG